MKIPIMHCEGRAKLIPASCQKKLNHPPILQTTCQMRVQHHAGTDFLFIDY